MLLPKGNNWDIHKIWSYMPCMFTLLMVCQSAQVHKQSWTDAYEVCAKNNSIIATTDKPGFWLPNFTIITPWLSLEGCHAQTPSNFSQTIKQPTDCVLICGTMKINYFALRKTDNLECHCFNTTKHGNTGNCSFCNDKSSKLWCGYNTSFAVYRVRSDLDSRRHPNSQCMYKACKSDGETVNPSDCNNKFPFVCASDNSGRPCVSNTEQEFMASKNACSQLYYPQNESVCIGRERLQSCSDETEKNVQFWLHIIREKTNCTLTDELCLQYIENKVPDQCLYVANNHKPSEFPCDRKQDFTCKKSNGHDVNQSTSMQPHTEQIKIDHTCTATCTMQPVNNQPVTEQPTTPVPWVWIAVGGAALLLLIFLTVFIICYRKYKKRNFEHEEVKEFLQRQQTGSLNNTQSVNTNEAVEIPLQVKSDDFCGYESVNDSIPLGESSQTNRNNTATNVKLLDDTISKNSHKKTIDNGKNCKQTQDMETPYTTLHTSSVLNDTKTNASNLTECYTHEPFYSTNKVEGIYDHLHDQSAQEHGDESMMYGQCLGMEHEETSAYNTLTPKHKQGKEGEYEHVLLSSLNDYDTFT